MRVEINSLTGRLQEAGWSSWEIFGRTEILGEVENNVYGGRATCERLKARLGTLANEPCAVLLIGHGKYVDGNGYVILEKDDGMPAGIGREARPRR